MRRRAIDIEGLAADLARTAVAAGLSALVALVVNRLPCVEVEGFEDGVWPSEGWVAAAEAGGTLAAASAHDGPAGIAELPWHYRTDRSLAQGARLSAWVRADRDGAGRFYLGFDASAAGCKSLVLAFNTGDLRFHENPAFGYTELQSTGVQLATGRWYLVEVEIAEGGEAVGRLLDADGTTLLATVRQTFDDGIGRGGIAIRSFGGVSADTITLCP